MDLLQIATMVAALTVISYAIYKLSKMNSGMEDLK